MKIRRLLPAAALAAVFAGCGKDKCATESPAVSAMAKGCTAVQGQTVSYPLRLCPACNLSNVTCDAQIQGGNILLNPTAQACESPSSCSASCLAQQTSCAFTAPAAGTYTVMVYDPATAQTLSEPFTVNASGSGSCVL